jgi:hypothetical protein
MQLLQNSDAVFMSVMVATNITVLADQALLLWMTKSLMPSCKSHLPARRRFRVQTKCLSFNSKKRLVLCTHTVTAVTQSARIVIILSCFNKPDSCDCFQQLLISQNYYCSLACEYVMYVSTWQIQVDHVSVANSNRNNTLRLSFMSWTVGRLSFTVSSRSWNSEKTHWRRF